MKEAIHPPYNNVTVVCACGNTFPTRSTATQIRLEICSNCHPFYTGRQKLMDTAGRVERFEKRYAATGGQTVVRKAVVKKAAPVRAAAAKKAEKVLRTTPKAGAKPKPKTDKAPVKAGK
jgi:large subunit ribosomal protein L31